MSRYYILTRRNELRVIEASAVEESHPWEVRFVAESGTNTFNRDELLWWSPVLSTPPAPFSDFDSVFTQPEYHTPGAPLPWRTHDQLSKQPSHNPHSPGQGHGPVMSPLQPKPEFSELSGASTAALIRAVLPEVPPEWKKAALELKVIYVLIPGRYKISHRLRNPDTDAEAFDFSDELSAAIEVFHRIHAEGRQNWNESTLILHREVRGNCRTEVKYNYGTNFGPR